MRWADLDQLGHVNNVVYVDYLQEARVDMLRSHGRGPEALAAGIVSVAVLAQSVATHHRTRVARHQSIHTYYRGLVLAH